LSFIALPSVAFFAEELAVGFVGFAAVAPRRYIYFINGHIPSSGLVWVRVAS